MGKLVNTVELAAMLSLHRYTVGKLFKASFKTHSRVRHHPYKLYDVDLVAAQISKASGHEITADELPDLIRLREARAYLAAQDKPRSVTSWDYWHRTNVGPRRFKVGCFRYYLRHEVEQWAESLPVDHPNGFQAGQPPETKRANGPNGCPAGSTGGAGVSLAATNS